VKLDAAERRKGKQARGGGGGGELEEVQEAGRQAGARF
jgi:hypothetical protein